MNHPAAVTACNLDLENLITDVNRSIATLAITTLLKVSGVRYNMVNMISNDSSVKQIEDNFYPYYYRFVVRFPIGLDFPFIHHEEF